jgi:dipeptidyl aminopeptidase/acylaminoacyl peptidase
MVDPMHVKGVNRRRMAVAAATAVAVVLGLVIGLGLRSTAGRTPETSSAVALSAAATVAPISPTATAALNPLTIAAMRARTYPASTLTTLRVDGDQGGYVNSVVSYESDGLAVHALLSVPDQVRPAAGWPAIILLHGYIIPADYVTDDASYQQFIAAFAHAGYLVIKPDFRGNGESQGQAVGGHFSPDYTADVMNLISTLRADRVVNPARIGLFGHSMGGQVALNVAVISHQVKSVVLMAGVVGSFYDIFYNWPNSPVTTDPPLIAQQIRTGLIARYGTPKQDPAFWNSVSAINDVGSITASIQIDVDSGDTVVPPLFSAHLAAALTAAGVRFEYYRYPGDDHQFIANRSLALARMVAFYRATL